MKNTRFPKAALKRYAELVLRQVYQVGGRERYIPLTELEDTLGLERWRILELCRTRLLGEIHVSWRLPAEVEESFECRSPTERLLLRACASQAHVRIRPEHVRLSEEELLHKRKKRKRKKKKKKRN